MSKPRLALDSKGNTVDLNATDLDPAERVKTIGKCGFCLTNNHETCNPAVRGPRKQVWLCGCPDCEKTPRCLVCHRTGRELVQDVASDAYLTCTDAGECDRYVQSQRSAAHVHLVGEEWAGRLDERSERKVLASMTRTERKAVQQAKKARDCVCGCGGTTKGGLFLPGHDARLLFAKVKCVVSEGCDPVTTRAEFVALGASEALLAKYDKTLATKLAAVKP